MRQFRYPTAIPPLDVRPIDPDTGFWTYEWRAWLESMQIQAGGQGGDALYDADIRSAVQAEENRAILDEVAREQRQLSDFVAALRGDQSAEIDALRREVDRLRGDIAQALASLGDLAREGQVVDSLVSRGAAIRNFKIRYPDETDFLDADTSIGTTETILCEVEVSEVDIPAIFFFANALLTFDNTGGAASSDSVVATWRVRDSNTQGSTAGNIVASGTVDFTTVGGTVIENNNSFPPGEAFTIANTGTVYLTLTLQTDTGTVNVTGNGTNAETHLRYVGFGSITE